MRLTHAGLTVALLTLAAGTAVAVDAPAPGTPGHSAIAPMFENRAPGAAAPLAPLSPDAEALLKEFPGLRILRSSNNQTTFYGMPMTFGPTPADAAGQFLARHGGALGLAGSGLSEAWRAESEGRFVVFAYTQTIDGLPVEFGHVRVLVHRNENGEVAPDRLPRVVYASATVADGSAGLNAAQVTGEDAAILASGQAAFRNLPVWGAAEEVVWFGNGSWTQPRRAWRVVGEEPELSRRQKYSVFIDAATGDTIHVRNEVLNFDQAGTVQGRATPGLGADTASNPPVLRPIWKMNITAAGIGSAFSNSLGQFLIDVPTADPVTLTASVSGGQFVDVNERTSGQVELSLSQAATPGTPATLTFNNSPTQFATAQVNAFVHTISTHDFFRSRGTLTGLDIVLPANTGVTGACNAFFDGASINFYNAGVSGSTSCNNTSFSTVIAHEYGHFIVNRLGLGQGGFGEGFSDVVAMLQYDTGIVGQNFTTSGGIVRNPQDANQQYPCSSTAVHTCGQIIGGVFWETRRNFTGVYGSAAGLTRAQQLFVSWALVSSGGQGTNFLNSAHPQTAVEVLTINDNDGNISNGTPDYATICNAFGQHGISCPAIAPIEFQYPSGRPAIVTPNRTTPVNVVVAPLGGTPLAGTGRLFYSIDKAPFVETPMTENAPNNYTAVLPSVPCGGSIEYYFRAQATGGSFFTDPASAPAADFVTVSATGQAIAVDAPFETTPVGWSLGVAGDTATTGQWTWGNPIGTTAQPEDDHTPAPGVNCFFTGQGTPGSTNAGEADVDNGRTTLLSPAFDLTGAGDAKISYWRWYSNNLGGAPGADIFVVDISNDNGTTWQRLETVGPTGDGTTGGWRYAEFLARDVITSPLGQVRLRWIAEDAGTASLIEAAVDDLRIDRYECAPPPPACAADIDGNGSTGANDLSILLAAFGAASGDPNFVAAADLDRNGAVGANDLSALLADFGCTRP
ncbi:MAG: hypothetical protein IBJ11_05605 [Phycisphaerales bacterium]|nr:hypothetical protein [Phycisphaerales bacterium]